MKRGAGILMPIFSLPNKSGFGTMGKEAYEFVDFLVKSKQTYWQILPINETDDGISIWLNELQFPKLDDCISFK